MLRWSGIIRCRAKGASTPSVHFVRLGGRELRLTGGEPLVRRGFDELVTNLSRHLHSGTLDELMLTTNGTRLSDHAAVLVAAGVRRINVSLDTLDSGKFFRLTRGGNLPHALAGIETALAVGLRIKLNIVALAQDNAEELPGLIAWAHARGTEASLIETMPLGTIEQDRTDQHL
jgi:GTP 3',8-cyclase